VVAVATNSPAPPATLVRIARTERWLSRYAVKRALVLNPHTPPQLSVRLLATFGDADLHAIAADENLSGPVRDQARDLLSCATD